ncbi:uncharacterized [Tachysurus ichikawai]
MGKVQKGADERMWNMCGIQTKFKLDTDLRCEGQYAATAFGSIRSQTRATASFLKQDDTSARKITLEKVIPR